MNYKVPGLLSVGLIGIAIGIAGIQLFLSSAILGAAYVCCFPVVMLSMLYFYCRKCPHVALGTCRHVIPGPIVKAMFKPVEPSNYKLWEMALALIPFAVFIIFPQFWLLKNIPLVIIFWTLMLLGGILVRTSVCPKCQNVNCFFLP